jgi:hypothetical protein
MGLWEDLLGEEAAVGDANQGTAMPGEDAPVASHRGLIMQLITVVVGFGEGQDVADTKWAVPETLGGVYNGFVEEEDFPVLVEPAQFQLFLMMAVGASAEFGRLFPTKILPRIKAGN